MKVRLIDNLGTNTPVDIHVGVSVPGGSIYELDGQLGFYPLPSNPGVSHPLIKNITIPAGTDTGEVTLLNYPFTGKEPGGTYTVFGAVTETGAYNVLSADTKSGVYTPPDSTPLPPGITLSCVGVQHFGNESRITVCVNLTNVPRGNEKNVAIAVTSTAIDNSGYDDTYSSDNTQLVRVCGYFAITQYGTYHGQAGVMINGQSATVDWDINVTSAPQSCSK